MNTGRCYRIGYDKFIIKLIHLLYNRNLCQIFIFAPIKLLNNIPQEIRKSQGNIRNFEVDFCRKTGLCFNISDQRATFFQINRVFCL